MNELTKGQSCILLRNGMQVWIDNDKAEKLQVILQDITESKFIKFEDKTLNTADITGVFTAFDLEEFNRIKNGEWKCKKGNWHAKGEDCRCGWSNTEDWEEPKTGESTGKGLEALRNTVQEMRNSL
jgi:hypothetical protein